MNYTFQIEKDCTTVRIDHDASSYGIFCFNNAGDLFVNSDWGFYAYAWRSFGPVTFKEFLSKCNSDYIMNKFETNYFATSGKQKIPATWRQNLEVLVKSFIETLNSSI